MLEPLRALLLAQAIKSSLFSILRIGHAQLVQNYTFLPALEDPHSRREKLSSLVHVPEMRRAESKESMEFIFVLFESREGGSNNQPSKTVANEGEAAELRAGARLSDVLVNFLCKSFSHLEYVHISFMLVGLSAEEESIWQRHRDNILENPDIERSALEPMTEHNQVHALVCGCRQRWVYLLLEVRILLDFKSVGYPILTPILDVALFEDEGCISLHVLVSPILLSLFVNNNVEFFHWLEFSSIELHVHLYNFSGFLGNNVI